MLARALLGVAALPVAAAALLLVDCHKQDVNDPSSVLEQLDAGAVCVEMQTGDFKGLVFGERGPLDPPLLAPLPPGTGENVKFLLSRAWRLAKTGPGYEKELIDACVELGMAAGLAEKDLRADPDLGHGAERACSTATGRIADIFKRAHNSKVVLDVSIEPTHCFVDVERTRACLTECGSPPQGDVRAHCIGGELEGVCSGRCSGSCIQPPGAGLGLCHGACNGKCEKDFRGQCGGKCTGTCDGAPMKGKGLCGGVCEGACSDQASGVCAGRCDGSCTGWWEPPQTAGRCSGVCVGVCSGDVRDGLCSGEYAPRGADPLCLAACGAEGAMALRCDTPLVRVAVRSGKPTPDLQRALVGVQSAVPKMLRLREGAAKRLPHAIEVAVSNVVDWSNAHSNAGAHPLLCVRANVDAMREASKWVELATRATEGIGPAIKTDPIVQTKPDDE